MNYSLNSTFLLTILLSIGLFFFLRASSKDRTTTIDIFSSRNPIDALDLVCSWLKLRGWYQVGGDSDKKILIFKGQVDSSKFLAVFLSILGGLGSCSLALVVIQIYPDLRWWPLLLGFIGGPLSGFIYSNKSQREEIFELRLINDSDTKNSKFRIRAHRDELIALETDLKEELELESDGSLYKTPI